MSRLAKKGIKCFECDAPADHEHHVVPRTRGGTKTVPLCPICHALVHDTKPTTSALTKEGLERARARGVRLGPPRTVSDEACELIKSLREDGCSWTKVAVRLNEGQVPTGQGRGTWYPATARAALISYERDLVWRTLQQNLVEA